MEPDILLVDEILAVGDAEFQKKCLGKMEEVTRKEERTILFVSHNMGAIEQLCHKTILLENGNVRMIGNTKDVIAAYLKDRSNKTINFPVKKPPLIINHFDVFQKGSLHNLFSSDKIINILIDIELEKDLTHFRIGFFLKTINGEVITQALIADWQKEYSTLKKGKYKIEGIIPSNFLNAGKYLIELHSSRYGIINYDLEKDIFQEFTVTPPLKYNENYKNEKTKGCVLINPFWNINKYA
jgi:lipopolysaccharide transport system ATP-binding protein